MNTERTTRTGGFTLIELMIVIAVLGIVAAVSFPVASRAMPNYRLKRASRQLFTYMQKARSEAVKRNTNVGIEFDTIDGGGYTVFLDDGTGGGAAGNAFFDESDDAILFQVDMPDGCTLYQANFGAGTTTGYNYRGLPLNNLSGSVRMRNDTARWYQISLSTTGHPSIAISGTGE